MIRGQVMRRVETSWRLLEDVFREHLHSLYRNLRRPASAANLAYLERTIGRPIPPAWRRSLLVHDGVRRQPYTPFFNGSCLLSAREVARIWRMRCRAHAVDDPGGPEDADPRIRNDLWWRLGWIPITDQDGNYHVVDLDPAPGGKVGQVILFRNSGGGGRVIASGYAAWLDHIAGLYHGRRFGFNVHGSPWMDDQTFFYGG